MFIKNISESAIFARVMGTKQPIEAGETVEMTQDEASNVLAMYPKIFQIADKTEETKETEETKKPTKNSKK